MENSPEKAEYLIMLQPSESTPLAQLLDSQRAACLQVHGADETNLYPMHVSVTGYFWATEPQAERVTQALQCLLEQRTPESLRMDVQHVAATDEDGYVIVLVSAPGLKEMAHQLSLLPEAAGLDVRPKRVSHMSLAKGRSPEQQHQIMQFFEEVRSGPSPMDLVFYRLLKRSDVQEFTDEGTPHRFQTVFRTRVHGTEPAEGSRLQQQLVASASSTPKTSPRSVASTAVTTDSGRTSIASAAVQPDKLGLESKPKDVPCGEAPFFMEVAPTGTAK